MCSMHKYMKTRSLKVIKFKLKKDSLTHGIPTEDMDLDPSYAFQEWKLFLPPEKMGS